MPYINSASIQSGQIIQANHVLNVINTFNDTATTDIKMKGTASFNEVNIANLRVTGTASIDMFVTTYYSSSIIYASGSTKFGDSADDTHQYTGSLGVSGSLRVNGTTQLGILGVNTKSPLVLNPDTSGGSVYYVKNDGAFVIGTGGDPYSGGVDAVAVNGFGNVGIGKTVPTSKLDVLGNVAVTGSVNVTGNITAGGLIGTASHALSSSFATTASYALNAGTTVFTGSFATTGSNTFRGAQLFTGSIRLLGDQTITGSLTVSGSSTLTNIGPMVLVGSLVARGGDNVAYLSADRSVTTIITNTPFPTTASFVLDEFSGGSEPSIGSVAGGSYEWTTSFLAYYAGVSGSGETQLSDSANAIAPGPPPIGDPGVTQIQIGIFSASLAPSGSIQSYKVYINSGSSWYVKSGVAAFATTAIVLSGNTSTNFITDITSAGFSTTTSPVGNVNTIIYNSQSLSTSATSSVAMNASVAVTGSLLVTQNITGNLIGSASSAISSSFATTASYALNGGGGSTFTGSFATTGSNRFVGNQTVTGSITVTNRINGDVFGDLSGTASYAFNLVNGIFTSSYATTGSNVFRGTQTISGSVNITGSLTVSGSSTFTNIGPTILRGTLAIVGEDGGTFLSASRTISSSLSSSIEPTTAEFLGSGSLGLQGPASHFWNSDFQFFYSGVSGSGETEVGGKYDAFKDDAKYSAFKFIYDDGITLSPSGSIDRYNLYVRNVNTDNWFVTHSLTLADLQSGPKVDLTGPTNTNFETDLISKGFVTASDPQSNVNTITYTQPRIAYVTSSVIVMTSPRIHPTSSGTPNFTGSDGQFIFGSTGGNHYMYVWMNNAWRSSSLV
jgi:hypothetical protein